MVDGAYKAMNRTHEQIRLHGAIGSFAEGIEISIHGIRTRLIAWPGNGFQTESVHVLPSRRATRARPTATRWPRRACSA